MSEKKVMREHMEERFSKAANYCENPPLPSSLNIELNSTCNHNCVFCPFHGKYAKNHPKPALIQKEMAFRILDEANRLGIGKKEVGFYLAGEVFLYNDLAEVIAYAKKLGFNYTFITTNGSMSSPEKIKEVLDAGLDSIRFSVNATDRESYREIHGRDDFDKVVHNIKFTNKYIKENNLSVATSLSCVFTKKTIGIKDDIKNIFSDYVDDIVFFPAVLNRHVEDEDFMREHQLFDDSKVVDDKDAICPVIFDVMYINANLEVLPCCEAYDSNCVFYDLKKDFDLEKAWNSELFVKYRKMFINKQGVKGTICDNCLLLKKGYDSIVD